MPITIDVSKLKLDWSVELGNKRRLHQVAVANSQVMVSGYDKRIWVLDSATGKIQWSQAYTSGFSVNPPSFAFRGLAQYDEWTPAVDANYAYAFVGGILSALDKKTGAVVYF